MRGKKLKPVDGMDSKWIAVIVYFFTMMATIFCFFVTTFCGRWRRKGQIGHDINHSEKYRSSFRDVRNDVWYRFYDKEFLSIEKKVKQWARKNDIHKSDLPDHDFNIPLKFWKVRPLVTEIAMQKILLGPLVGRMSASTKADDIEEMLSAELQYFYETLNIDVLNKNGMLLLEPTEKTVDEYIKRKSQDELVNVTGNGDKIKNILDLSGDHLEIPQNTDPRKCLCINWKNALIYLEDTFHAEIDRNLEELTRQAEMELKKAGESVTGQSTLTSRMENMLKEAIWVVNGCATELLKARKIHHLKYTKSYIEEHARNAIGEAIEINKARMRTLLFGYVHQNCDKNFTFSAENASSYIRQRLQSHTEALIKQIDEENIGADESLVIITKQITSICEKEIDDLKSKPVDEMKKTKIVHKKLL
ncbi:uncharacterized protein LOC141908058 isoform X2 [Tubulanus polymorphus]|uniref:uncharacterized protein LOC141908058 isoform X2 n=1 Tax=Tubulanus polymorphus TaxID=672921 RepID=UPI003DA1E670